MAGTIYSGTYTTGIYLSNPATQRPVTVTGKITAGAPDSNGISGNAYFAWTVNNKGTIEDSGTGSFGIQLLAGGTVDNLVAGSVSPGGVSGAALISGYSVGVLVHGAPGAVANLGEIEATGTAGIGIDMSAGGNVVNGSAAVATALISGDTSGVAIDGGAGTVTNFGTVERIGGGIGAGVELRDGGRVTNGSSTSTFALIENAKSGGRGVYIGYRTGIVTNFGTIEANNGGNGVSLGDGGRVANGASGSTEGLITGNNNPSVIVWAAAGTVANFGTIEQSGTSAAVELLDGGTVTNGAIGATGALLTSLGTGVFADNAPVTVTNFGRIRVTSVSRGSAIALEDGGSVSNLGTVQNAASSATGVYLHGSGSVTNGKTGLISGAGTGVGFRGGVGTVANSGVISSATANAIYLGGGGTVTNLAGAKVTAPGNGILTRGAAATITNAGAVASTGSNGIYISLGGTLTNVAGGVVAGVANGVYNRNLPSTVINDGLIKTTGTGDGVYLRGGGSIVNEASGRIVGSAAGVYFHRQPGIVTNRGTITGKTGFEAVGAGANTVINYGAIASTGGAAGIAVEMGNNTGRNLLIVEKGAVFTGAVLGGGRGEIDFAAPGTAAMTASISGFDTVRLASGGADNLTLTNANFADVTPGRITVYAGNDGNTVNAFAGGPVTIYGGGGADVLTGGAGGHAIFVFSAASLLAADKVVGGGYGNELEVTTAGTVAAAGVAGVETYQLANGGANTLILVNNNFTGVPPGAITVYGGTGGNTINGSGLTKAGENLVIYGGGGADVLKGGAGNDVFVFAAANLTNTDTIAGGGGSNELLMTSAGTVHANGVSAVETYVLADGLPNILTLASGNFAGVTGGTITVSDGANGNTVSFASGLPAADHIVVYAGSGLDTLTGGAGNDVFHAGGDTVMKGGLGTNQFWFSGVGSNTIRDFSASTSNKIVLSDAGFGLGPIGSGPLPASLFTENPTGAFTKPTQRFVYDTANGELFYSASGTTASEHLVATLTGHPALALSQIFHG